jgi:hypothetical protein
MQICSYLGRIWFIKYIRFSFFIWPGAYTVAAMLELGSYALRLSSITMLMGTAVHLLRAKPIVLPLVGAIQSHQPLTVFMLGIGFFLAYMAAGVLNYLANLIVIPIKKRHADFIAGYKVDRSTGGRATIFVSKIVNRALVAVLTLGAMLLLTPALGLGILTIILISTFVARNFIRVPDLGDESFDDDHAIRVRHQWALLSAGIQAATIGLVFIYFTLENSRVGISVARIVFFFFLVRLCLTSVQAVFGNVQRLYQMKLLACNELNAQAPETA